jgi:hypothetical protein
MISKAEILKSSNPFPWPFLAVGFFILLKHSSFHSSNHSYTDNILNNYKKKNINNSSLKKQNVFVYLSRVL